MVKPVVTFNWGDKKKIEKSKAQFQIKKFEPYHLLCRKGKHTYDLTLFTYLL